MGEREHGTDANSLAQVYKSDKHRYSRSICIGASYTLWVREGELWKALNYRHSFTADVRKTY